jgi:undecaprenyl-diphosphatase
LIGFYKSIVYGIVQGLTEFLPVSSSGHLVIVKHYLAVEDAGITMEVLTHAATALAALIYMRRRVGSLLIAGARAVRHGPGALDGPSHRDARLLLMLILASVPAAAAGVLMRNQVEGLFTDVPGTARMLIATGVFVFLTGRFGRGQKTLSFPRSLLIGVAQAVAILPGLSRSGLTVGAGLGMGVERTRAFEFALLLSIPVIMGATLFEAAGGRLHGSWPVMTAGFTAAFISGYAAISLLYRAVRQHRFYFFAFYLIPLGIILLLIN